MVLAGAKLGGSFTHCTDDNDIDLFLWKRQEYIQKDSTFVQIEYYRIFRPFDPTLYQFPDSSFDYKKHKVVEPSSTQQ